MPALTIWYDTLLSDEDEALLRAGVSGHRLVRAASTLAPGPGRSGPDAALSEADIAFGQPAPDQVIATPRVRWVHLSSAGYTPYDRVDLWNELRARGGALTKSSLVYDEPCAEHMLALLTAHARVLLPAHVAQCGDRAWPTKPLRARSRLLVGQRVVIFGMGTIGRRLCELLAPLRMDLCAVRRQVTGDEPVRTLAMDDPEIDRVLYAADHVINILPASGSTRRTFDAARFARMKEGVVFYNIGRGTTVDQEALLAALRSGAVSAAYLDVTDPEPLPIDHPLWTTANCYITPHTGGGHQDEATRLVHHFLDNFRRFVAGQPLLDRVVGAGDLNAPAT